MAKHKFVKHKKPDHRGAPMRAEEAANTAGDPPVAGPMPPPMMTAPAQAAPAAPMGGAPGGAPGGGVPGQAHGGSVSKIAPLTRMHKMYSPKRVSRSAA